MAGIMSMDLSEEELNPFVSNANEVIHFRLIRDQKDLEEPQTSEFDAEFTHQFFGESENIFGYIGLSVTLSYSAARLSMLFDMSYAEKVKTTKSGGVEADDVYKIVCEKLEMEPGTNLDAFSANLSKESGFRPHGELLKGFSVEMEENETLDYEVYRADMSIPGFREYHQRMQTFILWFIDAASYIDVDDDRWEYFVMHQRVRRGGETLYPFVGFATVYRYYAYPTKVRPRISQMLILPPFQRSGLGARMLEVMNEWYVRDAEVLDITVEDPSESFVRLRDFVDCKNCATLPSFRVENLKRGLSQEMLGEARERFKINRKQCRRVFEILRLKQTNVSDERDYKRYRLEVKNRLNAPFQRQKMDMEKLRKSLSDDELKATLNGTPREQRMEQLGCLYKDLEAEYRQVIERLDLMT